mgnify:CR=1 FL=1
MSISFPDGQTGTSLLHEALGASRRIDVGLPELPDDPKRFRQALPDLICRFEARRAASGQRVAVARQLSAHVREHTRFGDASLEEALAGGTASPLTLVDGTAKPGWVPELSYRGETYRGAAIGALAQRLRDDHQLTQAAADALRWVAREMLHEPVVLTGHRFAVLGAAAELAPTPYLLAAGARVLWVDKKLPTLAPADYAGTLAHAADASDLLEHTPAIAAQLARAASDGPLHVGLFAYAPGKGRELKLTTAMNALADGVDDLASVTMWVSPTTPGEVQPEDRADRFTRRQTAPRWQRALSRARLLPEPAYHSHGDVQIARSIVPLQGPTYLAAQYLTKMMAAEAWAVDRAPMRVSANVAGITHTASLEHPLFLAGFRGAPTFGVQIFRPDQTRVLSTLLMLHDLFHEQAPAAATDLDDRERARRVAERAVHGGVRSAPFVFDHTIRVAAVVGLAKQPSLLAKLRS